MNWNYENTKQFINLVKERPLIWDTSLQDSKNKVLRRKMTQEIADLMGISFTEAYSKWFSLRGQYAREQKKLRSCGNSKPKWFAYTDMEYMIEKNNNSTQKQIKQSESNQESSPSSSESIPGLLVPKNPLKRTRITKERLYSETFEALNMIKKRKTKIDDELTAYGQFVAAQIRKFKPRLQIEAKRQINNSLLKLEMDNLDCLDNIE